MLKTFLFNYTENIYTQFTSTSFMHSLYSFLPFLTYHFLYLLLFTASVLPYISFCLSSPLYRFLTSLSYNFIFFTFSFLQFPSFLLLPLSFLYLLLITVSFVPSRPFNFIAFSFLQFPSFPPNFIFFTFSSLEFPSFPPFYFIFFTFFFLQFPSFLPLQFSFLYLLLFTVSFLLSLTIFFSLSSPLSL